MSSTLKSNDDLCKYMERQRMLRTPKIVEAFRAVDRGDFVPSHVGSLVYMDQPVRSGKVHLSAPFIYAAAMEEFGLEPGMSFLNIGSGTGYLSCVASVLLGPDAVNHGVEINPALVQHARRCVSATDEKLGRRQTDVQFVAGNGFRVEAGFRYDRVYVGAGCSAERTRDYLYGLLNVGGVLVVPFGDQLVRVERKCEETFKTTTLCSVCFAPATMPSPEEENGGGGSGSGGGTPPVRFCIHPWSPACHAVYPPPFRRTVLVVLMANRREGTLPHRLPPALWLEIMSFMHRDWFPGVDAADGGGCGGGEDEEGEEGALSVRGARRCASATLRTVALLPVKAGAQVGCTIT